MAHGNKQSVQKREISNHMNVVPIIVKVVDQSIVFSCLDKTVRLGKCCDGYTV